jgi:hypothetical protein
MPEKLTTPKAKDESDRDVTVWIGRKANALIDEIVKKSGQSKNYVASRMIEYAYDHTEVQDDEES